MELKVMIRYRGDWAHYQISPETIGICEARLLKYEGKSQNSPPPQILLLKSFRHWVGSSDEQNLMDELGYALDNNHRNRDDTSPESRY